jgi:hypothetical protein
VASLPETFDLLAVLYRVDPNTMCNKIFGINYEALSKIIYPAPRYKTFLIKKKNGGHRVISEPRAALKAHQYKLLNFLEDSSGEMKRCVHGFTEDRSVVTNARQHTSPKTRFVLNVDLENFFPSISFYRVRGLFQARPFNFSFNNATILAQVCCHGGVLPQGAPTSPILANLICRSLDKKLMDLAYRNRATYTRYCDDLTFSFTVTNPVKLPGGICGFDGSVVTLGAEFQEIIKSNGFAPNVDKTRLSGHSNRMEVTGLTINKFPNVQKKFSDSIRGALHAWGKYGYVAAQEVWAQRPYLRQRRTDAVPQLHKVLWGRLLYLKMVRSSDDLLYTRLAEKYNRLVSEANLVVPKFDGKLLKVSPVVRNATDASDALFVIECSGDHPSGEVVLSQGTAFAYGEAGLITCDHVIRYKKPAPKLGAQWFDDGSEPYFDDLADAKYEVVRPATGERRNFTIAFRDSGRDIALLKLVGEPFQGMRHFAALEAPLLRHERCKLLGFPNWTPARTNHNDLDGIVTNRFAGGGLQRLEIDTLIRQGNSGGPLVDSQYRIAGVAQQGATQENGNNESLCVTEVQRWLELVQPKI